MTYWRLDFASSKGTPPPQLLGKVYQARDMAEAILLDIFEKEKDDFQSNNNDLCQRKLQKIERMYNFQTQKAQKELEERKTVLTRLRKSSKPDDQRIIPAWEGRVREAERQMEEIKGKKQEQLGELEKRKDVSYSYQLLSVAMVEFGADSKKG